MLNAAKQTKRSRIKRLIIADDHELTRAGLRSMIANERGLQVVGEAENGRQAFDLCEQMHPDLVLMDIRMPDIDGLASTRLIKAAFAEISVVILTFHGSPDYLYEAVKAGAAAYLLKDTTRQDLIRVIRQVLRGEATLTAHDVERMLRRLASETETRVVAPRDMLTPRVWEVLQQIATGKTNREIAEVLKIGHGTVKTHVEHIFSKLGVSDRTQASVRAMQIGLIA